jgi:O-antigen/teichoic acid export membrane protein
MSIDYPIIRDIIKISVPLIQHVLASVIISLSDRVFIESMVGVEAVGLYAVGYSFGMIVMIFTDSFIKAWSPWFYKKVISSGYSEKLLIVRLTYYCIFAFFVLSLVVPVISSSVLPYVVSPEFLEANDFILWIALGYGIRGVYQLFLPYLVHINQTSFLAFSTVVAALLNIGLNFFLIDLYGAIGAAYSTVAAFSVSAILVFEFQRRRFFMPWGLGYIGNKKTKTERTLDKSKSQ